MRSMPPASWHLAERPVPAPPPTMGSPRATMALNLSSRSDRWKRGMSSASPRPAALLPAVAVEGAEGVCQGRSEPHIVDVVGQANELPAGRQAHGLLQRPEQ